MAKARNVAKRIVTGDKEIDASLQHLKIGGANKIIRKGFTKALRVGLKAMKAKVPAQYKEAKKALGSRIDRKGGKSRDQHRAKVGAAVGKASAAEPKSRKKGTGVGIGGANLHWFIQGTSDRDRKKIGGSLAKYNKSSTSKSTGAMAPVMPDIVKGGFSSASGQMMAVIRETVTTELEKEAAKTK